MAWDTYTVQLKGEDPIEVQPRAPDYAAVSASADRPVDYQFRVIHHALWRMRHPNVPLNYDAFLEILEDIPTKVAEPDGTGPLDPTNPDL